jgi:hypothetical protein
MVHQAEHQAVDQGVNEAGDGDLRKPVGPAVGVVVGEEGEMVHWGAPGSGVRILAPAPPPFSSISTTPCSSSARISAETFAAISLTGPSLASALRIVATPTCDAFARSCAVQPINPRPALSCLPVNLTIT